MMFELSFNFPTEQAKGFALINAALANLQLSDLKIAQQKGSLTLTKFPDPNKADEYAYVLSQFSLSCVQNPEAEKFRYQFDSAAYPWEDCDGNDYMENWKKDHPDLDLCFLQTITYESAKASVYNVLYREKIIEI